MYTDMLNGGLTLEWVIVVIVLMFFIFTLKGLGLLNGGDKKCLGK